MDIRDHFAGLAMQSIMQSEHHMDAVELLIDASKDIEIQDAIAIFAYTQAEAMVQLRNKMNSEKDKQKTVPIIEGATLEGKHLKSLEEHNGEAREMNTSMFSTEPQPNGIACPECGEELMDSNPMMTLTSMPAQKNVHCPKCKYTGYRIA